MLMPQDLTSDEGLVSFEKEPKTTQSFRLLAKDKRTEKPLVGAGG